MVWFDWYKANQFVSQLFDSEILFWEHAKVSMTFFSILSIAFVFAIHPSLLKWHIVILYSENNPKLAVVDCKAPFAVTIPECAKASFHRAQVNCPDVIFCMGRRIKHKVVKPD